MSPVTVFLVVLVLALLLGNFFLELVKPRKERAETVQSGETPPETQKLLMPSNALWNSISELNSRVESLEKKIEGKMGVPAASIVPGKELPLETQLPGGLSRKLDSISGFQREIKIEVAALKEQLKEVKGFIGMKEKQPVQLPEIDDKKLHELIYNTRK